MKHGKQKNRGISLIVLVITIIIMIILATAIVLMISGDNGLISKAKLAQEQTNMAAAKEEVEIAILSCNLENGDDLKSVLEDKLSVIIVDNVDSDYAFKYKNYNVVVSKSGTILQFNVDSGEVWAWKNITSDLTLEPDAFIKINSDTRIAYVSRLAGYGLCYVKINVIPGTHYKLTDIFAGYSDAIIYEYNDGTSSYDSYQGEPVNLNYTAKEIVIPNNCRSLYINIGNRNNFVLSQYVLTEKSSGEVINGEWVDITNDVTFTNGKFFRADGLLGSWGTVAYAEITTTPKTKYKITGTFGGYADILTFRMDDGTLQCHSYEGINKTYNWVEEVVQVPDNCSKIYVNKSTDYSFQICRYDAVQQVDKAALYQQGIELMNNAGSFTYRTLDKAYMSFVFDDTRTDIGAITELFASKGLPVCFATITSKLNNSVVYNGNTVTAKEVLQAAVRNGGEVLAHNGEFLTDLDRNDHDKCYRMFYQTKKALTDAGFSVDGIIVSGGSKQEDGVTYSANTTNMTYFEPWSRLYYKYSDGYGSNEPYKHLRRALGDYDSAKSAIDAAVTNKTWITTMCHGFRGTSPSGVVGQGQTILYDVTYDELANILDYIKGLGQDKIQVVTYSTFYNTFKPQ